MVAIAPHRSQHNAMRGVCPSRRKVYYAELARAYAYIERFSVVDSPVRSARDAIERELNAPRHIELARVLTQPARFPSDDVDDGRARLCGFQHFFTSAAKCLVRRVNHAVWCGFLFLLI